MKWNEKLSTDLMAFSAVKILVKRHYFQSLFFVLPALIIFVIATASLAFGTRNPALSFGLVFTWVVWWGLLIALYVILGRGWCIMCPFGALGEWVQRLSLWWKRKWGLGFDFKYPRRLHNLWMAIAFFIIFIFLDVGYGVSNTPILTVGLISVIVLGAIWVFFFFERRTFCLYHCPLTAFIGISSMLAPFEVRRKDAEVCRQCQSKACFRGSEHSYGCPTLLFQGGGVDTNRDCILCTECIKACPYDNITMRFRPWGTDLWRRKRGRLDEAVAAIVIAGLVTTVSLFLVLFLPSVKPVMDGLLPAGTPPNDWPRIASVALLFVIGVLATMLLMYGFSYLSRLFSGMKEARTSTFFIHFAYALVPLGVMKFLSDILDHVFRTWGALFDVVKALFQDFPFNRVVPEEVTVNQLMTADQTYLFQVMLITTGFGLSLLVAYRLAKRLFPQRDLAFRAFLPIGTFIFILDMAGLWALSAAL